MCTLFSWNYWPETKFNKFPANMPIYCDTFQYATTNATPNKKWSFPLKISSANVTKSAVSCGLRIWSHLLKKSWMASFFVQYCRTLENIEIHFRDLEVTVFPLNKNSKNELNFKKGREHSEYISSLKPSPQRQTPGVKMFFIQKCRLIK